MRNVAVYVREMPIYNSEHIKNVLDYYKLSKNEQTLFQNVLNALYSATDIDFPPEFVDLFVDGQKVNPALVKKLDFKTLLQDIINCELAITHSSSNPELFTEEPVGKEATTVLPTNYDDEILTRLKTLANLANKSSYPAFYYHQIPITQEVLFENTCHFPRIKKEFLPYLPFLDMQDISMTNVDLRKTNLANTNIKSIDFPSLYKQSITETNLENVNLLGQTLENVDATKANLCGTYLSIETTSTKLKKAVLDDSLIFLTNGRVVDPVKQGYSLVKHKNETRLHL